MAMKALKSKKDKDKKPLVPKWLLAATVVGVGIILLPQCGGGDSDQTDEDSAPVSTTLPPMDGPERQTWESLGIDPLDSEPPEVEPPAEEEPPETDEPGKTFNPTLWVVPNTEPEVAPEPEGKTLGGGTSVKKAPVEREPIEKAAADESPSFWAHVGSAAMAGASMNPMMPLTFDSDSDAPNGTGSTQTPNTGNSGGVQ